MASGVVPCASVADDTARPVDAPAEGCRFDACDATLHRDYVHGFNAQRVGVVLLVKYVVIAVDWPTVQIVCSAQVPWSTVCALLLAKNPSSHM